MGQVSGRERHSSHSEPPVGRQRPLPDLGSSSDLRRALRNIRRSSSISLRGLLDGRAFGAWMHMYHLLKYPGLLIETIGERRREITWTGPPLVIKESRELEMSYPPYTYAPPIGYPPPQQYMIEQTYYYPPPPQQIVYITEEMVRPDPSVIEVQVPRRKKRRGGCTIL
jgi:hypothetical protein